MSLNAILAWHRAHQPGLQERAPFVDQAAVAAIIILEGRGQIAESDWPTHPQTAGREGLKAPGLRLEKGSMGPAVPTRQIRPMRAYTAGLCGASADRSRKKK